MARRCPARISNETWDVYLNEREVVKIKAPSPDAYGKGSASCVYVASRFNSSHTQDNNESNAVWQWQYSAEVVELRLDRRITVHGRWVWRALVPLLFPSRPWPEKS